MARRGSGRDGGGPLLACLFPLGRSQHRTFHAAAQCEFLVVLLSVEVDPDLGMLLQVDDMRCHMRGSGRRFRGVGGADENLDVAARLHGERERRKRQWCYPCEWAFCTHEYVLFMLS